MTRHRQARHRAAMARRAIRLIAALAGCLMVVAAIAGLAELLRHPAPAGTPLTAAEPADDPRLTVACPELEPREGVGRDPRPAPARSLPTVGAGQLHACPQTWDGRQVRYRGEAVGAVFQRPEGAWVQLNDDAYVEVGPLPTHREYRGDNDGVGVHLPPEAAGVIDVVGGPGTRGDLVEIVGTFHRIDPDAEEVAVIRATSAEVVRAGHRLADPILVDRQIAAALLVPLALGVVALDRIVAARRRRAGKA